MEAIGLMPSNTGQAGGRKVGEQMTHYIIEGGLFARACAQLLTAPSRYLGAIGSSVLPNGNADRRTGQDDATGTDAPGLAPAVAWGGLLTPPPPVPVNRSNRLKYRCPGCGRRPGPSLVYACCAAARSVPLPNSRSSNDGSPTGAATRSGQAQHRSRERLSTALYLWKPVREPTHRKRPVFTRRRVAAGGGQRGEQSAGVCREAKRSAAGWAKPTPRGKRSARSVGAGRGGRGAAVPEGARPRQRGIKRPAAVGAVAKTPGRKAGPICASPAPLLPKRRRQMGDGLRDTRPGHPCSIEQRIARIRIAPADRDPGLAGRGGGRARRRPARVG